MVSASETSRTVRRYCWESALKCTNCHDIRSAIAFAIAIALCNAVSANDDDQKTVPFVEVDSDNVAFPEVELLPQSSQPLSSRKGDWLFSVLLERDRQVLSAESGETLVTQSITPNAVYKRFVFDMKKQRFEPMRQEIRIEQTDERTLRQIEALRGVSAVKRYENLGFSILKINVDVNPVEVLRSLRDEFNNDDARILTGLFEDEPM